MDSRNPEAGRQAQILARRAKAVALKARGATMEQIAEALGVNKGTVSRDIKAAIEASRVEIDENLIALRRMQDIRFDEMRRKIHAVLGAEHLVVQHGHVVDGPDGRPLRDPMPVLQAIDRLLKLEQAFNVLHGLNADERMTIAFENRSEVESAHTVEAILAAFAAIELPADVRQRALEAAQTRLAELSTPVIDAEVIAETEG
jgi:AcrR family transcriptional regulator